MKEKLAAFESLQPKHKKDLIYYQRNDIRTEALKIIWTHTIESVSIASEKNCYVEDIAQTCHAWSLGRFRNLVSILKHQGRRPIKLASIIDAIEAVNVMKFSHMNDIIDEEAENEVWRIFAVCVKQMDPIYLRNDPATDKAKMEQIGSEALLYFNSKLNTALQESDAENLKDAIYYLTRVKFGTELFLKFLPIAKKRITKDEMEKEVIPKLMLLCSIQRTTATKFFVDAVVKHAREFITPDTANSVLEYASHVNDSSLPYSMLGIYPPLVTVEGNGLT